MPQTLEERNANLAKGREIAAQNRAAGKAPKATLDDVMKALIDLSGRVAAVESKPTPQAGPAYVPMQAPVGPPRPAEAWKGLDGTEGRERRDAGGLLEMRTIDDREAQTFPRFAAGQRVKVKLDKHHGTASSKRTRLIEEDGTPGIDDQGRPVFERSFTYLTWGQVIDRIQTFRCQTLMGKTRCGQPYRPNTICQRCGSGPEVLKILWSDKEGIWKYKVRVPGLTQRLGDGFLEDELEAIG